MPTQRQHTDGRIARGERTREAIVDAHTALLREGVLKPTGQAIALRAGVSARTLWANFRDFEALLKETTRYWLETDAEMQVVVEPTLALADRIARYVEQRVRRLEHIAPAARSAALGEPFSAALQSSRAAHVQRGLDDLAVTFGPEIEASGSETLLRALFLATSWPSWSTLRDDFDLDVEAASAVMRTSCHALLDPIG